MTTKVPNSTLEVLAHAAACFRTSHSVGGPYDNTRGSQSDA